MNPSAAAPLPNDSPSPVLAPPGAGLPALERWISHLRAKWMCRRMGRGEAARVFASEREAILAMVASCTPHSLAKPVLIRRLRGMEDSSRNWSVLMTLDHLRIVNTQMARVIGLLAAGRTSDSVASTAAVKPNPAVDPTVVPAFEKACALLEKTAAGAANLHTGVKYTHPWYGPMDAAAWHCMAGFHMVLHRRQIAAILAGLPR